MKSNQELDKILTKLILGEGREASIEILTSWLYQRAVVRYRMGNYLGCSRDCDRVEDRCAGVVHGRV
jgi:hypothetical protein